MCEKYLVMSEGGDHHRFVETLDAVKKVVINRSEALGYDTVEDYLLDYVVEVYEINKKIDVSVETEVTYKWEFK